MTATSDQSKPSLKDRTVVVVGPNTDAQPYLSELETYGARNLNCPSVEIVDLESYERLDEAIEHLYGYDWLLFTSVHGVNSFLQRLQANGRESDSLDDLRVCAIEDATERFLREARVHVDVAPLTPQTHHVFAALEQFLGGASELTGLNFLVPRAASSVDSLTRVLTEAGARVDLLPAYRVRVRGSEQGRIAALLAGQADCILLTTTDSIMTLTKLFDAPDLSEILDEVLLVATDEATAKAGALHGLQIKVLPAEAKATARAVAEHLSGN